MLKNILWMFGGLAVGLSVWAIYAQMKKAKERKAADAAAADAAAAIAAAAAAGAGAGTTGTAGTIPGAAPGTVITKSAY